MDMFRSEKSQLDTRIPEVLPKLEDLGQRGHSVALKLHEIVNALKHPKSQGGQLFKSDKSNEEIKYDLEAVKGILDVYGEKASILIGDLTVILTQIGYVHIHAF
jgi:hypothetical protein